MRVYYNIKRKINNFKFTFQVLLSMVGSRYILYLILVASHSYRSQWETFFFLKMFNGTLYIYIYHWVLS